MATATVRTKVCNRCKRRKRISAFCRNRARWDGLQHYCRQCQHEYSRRPDQRVKRVAQVRRYQATEKGKATTKRTDEKRRSTQQVKARAKVRDRVAKGKMPPARSLACSNCGKPAHEYHHHRGYSPEHALDVIPVCRPCHRDQ